MFVCCLNSENNFAFAIGSEPYALRLPEIWTVASTSSRIILIDFSGSLEKGWVDCVGNASLVLKSCTADRIVRRELEASDGPAWLKGVVISIHMV